MTIFDFSDFRDEDEEKPSKKAARELKRKTQKKKTKQIFDFGDFETRKRPVVQEKKPEPKPEPKKTFLKKAKEKITGFAKNTGEFLFGKQEFISPLAEGDDDRVQMIGSVRELLRQNEDQLEQARKEFDLRVKSKARPGTAAALKEGMKSMFYTGTASLDKGDLSKLDEISFLKDTNTLYRQFLHMEDSNKGLVGEVFDKLKTKPLETIVPFYSEKKNLVKYASANRAMEKLNNGEELTSIEKASLENIKAQVLTSSIDVGLGDKVGGMLVDMVPYAMLYGMSSPISKAVEKKVVSKVSEKTASNIVKSVVSKSIGAAAQTSTVFVPKIAADTAEYMLPDYELVAGAKGDELIRSAGGGDGFKKALSKAWLVNYIEVGSEKLGDIVEPLSSKLVPKAVIGKFAKMNNVTDPNALRKLLKSVGWNGVVAEVFEEEIAELLQAPVEERKYYAPFVTPEGTERLLVETLGMSVLGGVSKVTDLSFNTLDRKGKPKLDPIKLDVDETIEEEVELSPVAREEIKKRRPEIKELIKAEKAKKYISAEDFAEAEFSTSPDKQIGFVSAEIITPRDPVDIKSKEYELLKSDIRESGIIEPVRVVEDGGEIEIIEGSNRVTIASELGVDVPVIVAKGKIEGLKTLGEVYEGLVVKPAKPTKPKPGVKPGPKLKIKPIKPVKKSIVKARVYKRGDVLKLVKRSVEIADGYQSVVRERKRIVKALSSAKKAGNIKDVKKIKEMLAEVGGSFDNQIKLLMKETNFSYQKSLNLLKNYSKSTKSFVDEIKSRFKVGKVIKSKIQPGVRPAKPTKKAVSKKISKKISKKKPKIKKFKPKAIKPTKKFVLSTKERKKVQKITRKVVFSGQTAEQGASNIAKFMKNVFAHADDPSYNRKLKTIRAELKRGMYELVGVDTGHWKRDYALLQRMRHDSSIAEIVNSIEDALFKIDEIVDTKTPPSTLGYATTGSQSIGAFEKRAKAREGTEEFKLYNKTIALVRKYARSIGEDYLPRKSLGVYHKKTKNIRINAINNLSTAAHEITHFLDFAYKISDVLLAVKGYKVDGKPIYDPKTLKYRREITKLYTKYYATGKPTHKLRKRTIEGFATLLQKYIEIPTTITNEFPLLVKDFLKKGGKYYKPVMGEIIVDLNKIVEDYQGLSDLDKIGSRVTSEHLSTDKKSFLSFSDRLRTQLVDKLYPIEVLAKRANKDFTAQDPTLWLRSFNSVSGIINNNINSKRGYWALKGNTFAKIHKFNWKTLVDITKERKNSDEFGFYLVARREHFAYQELDVMEKRLKELEKQAEGMTKEELEATNEDGQTFVELIKNTTSEYKNLKSILNKDGLARDEVDSTYTKNKDRFKEEEKMFDILTKEDLKFLNSENVQLINNQQYKELTSKQGYASFKRQFYDEILGDDTKFKNVAKVGGTRVSSLLRRKGSEKTIINPLYSGIANHSEVMRKGLKQVVYNKITNIGTSAAFPDLFQQQQLKSYIDPHTGAVMYPQEKDSNIIMGREDYKRVPVLVDREVKSIIDDNLTYDNIDVFERLFVGMSRMFTAGTTGYYPAFSATNFAVDQVTAQANTTNKYKALYSPIAQIRRLINDRGGSDSTYFEEYMVLGGDRQTFTGWQKLPPKELFKAINGEKSGLQKVISLMEKGTDVLATPAKYSEIITRATEYINARKAGKAQIVALEEAGRVTAPFHHIGKWGGRGGQTFIRGLPFFNASLQVLDQHARTWSTPAGKRRMTGVLLAVTAAYLASITKLINADDEQKEQYKDLEPEELANFLYFPHPSGKKLVRVKMSQSFSPLGTMINMIIADRVLDTKYKAKDYATAATAWLPDQFNPVDPIRAFLAWIPQVFGVGIETIVGVKTWPEVAPLESLGLKQLPPKMRTNENTSVFAKWLGEKAGLSPIKIDYLLTGYFGRSIGFATGKPSAYKFKNTVVRDYYFSYGRRVSGIYDMKEENDQNYTVYQRGESELSKNEVEKLYRTKMLTNQFTELMRDYRKIDIETDQEKAAEIRNEVLQIMNMIDNKDNPKGFKSWMRDAKKRRKKKIKELSKQQTLAPKAKNKSFLSFLVKPVYAAESTSEDKRRWYKIALKLRKSNPVWYTKNVGESGEKRMFGHTIGEWPIGKKSTGKFSQKKELFNFKNTPGIKIINNPKTGKKFNLSKPHGEAKNAIMRYFSDERGLATKAAAVSNIESGYNYRSVNDRNKPGRGIDVGLFQINENTFNDYVRRAKPGNNIYDYMDRNNIPVKKMSTKEFRKTFKDPMINAAMARLIYDYQGFGAWFGPRDNGIIIK